MDKKYKLVTFGKRDIIEDKKRSLTEMIFIFAICSILGWFVETGYVYLSVGRIVKRGMLMGPYCPIYGFGALILYFLFYNLKPTKANIPYTFLTASITMGAFELLSGLGFKYILNIEMWNYHGHFLSILDYTTVPILLGWGILGTIYVFFIHRLLLKIVSILPKVIANRTAILIILIYATDFVISVYRIVGNPDILYKLVNP
ncbi:MAG: putative ABC transporter permease [Clostridia bacterium]|nr:putative ABC transporter permease [Clostridia bacterium]